MQALEDAGVLRGNKVGRLLETVAYEVGGDAFWGILLVIAEGVGVGAGWE